MNKLLSDVSGSRNNNFDFLRFCLASLVILSHSYPLLSGSNATEPFGLATGGQRTGGEFAVDGFFILSGFLIARSWQSSKGLGVFLRSRVLRIYPGYLVAIAFSALIAAPILNWNAPSGHYWQEFSWRSFVAHGLNLTFYCPSNVTVNGSLWSIRYEFMCYLAVAFLGVCGLLSRRLVIFLGLLLCLGLYAGQIYFHLKAYGSSLSWLYCYPGDWPRVMSDFLAGVLFFACRDRIPLTWPLTVSALTILLTFGVLLPTLAALPLLVPVLGGYFLLFVAYLPLGNLDRFASRGDLSYGLYLYAFPIQMLLVQAFGPWLHPITLFLIALPLTAMVAATSWHFVERPCLRLKKRPASAAKPPTDTPVAPVEPQPAPAEQFSVLTSRSHNGV